MAIICRDYNILFVMTPRTASTAIGNVLIEKMGGEFIPKNDILNSNGYYKVQKKHSTIQQLLNNRILTSKELESLNSFTCVRNPFDNLVSLYTKKKIKYQSLLDDKNSWIFHVPKYIDDMYFCKTHSFNEWIFKNYKRGIIKRIIGGKPSMYHKFTRFVDQIIFFENLNSDFMKIMNQFAGIGGLTVPKVNTTSGRYNDYRSYYSKLSIRIVEFVLKDDLTLYNYSF